MQSIEIAPLADDDAGPFGAYIDSVYHPKYVLKDRRYLEWQYDSLCVAKAGGQIVGHLGFKDIAYKIHDTVGDVRVLMNFRVLPEFRTFGVGALLARKVFDTPNRVLVSGYSDTTDRLCRKLRPQWHAGLYFKRFLAILDPLAPFFMKYAERREVEALWSSLKTRAGENAGHCTFAADVPSAESLDGLWSAVRGRYPVTVERSHAYLAWRFFKHPLLVYNVMCAYSGDELLGFIVWRIEEDEGFRVARIVDCISREGACEPLFSAFLREAKKAGAHAAEFFFSGFLYSKHLFNSGFFDVSGTAFADFPTLWSPLSYKKTYINAAYDFEAAHDDCFLTKADGDQDRPNPH